MGSILVAVMNSAEVINNTFVMKRICYCDSMRHRKIMQKNKCSSSRLTLAGKFPDISLLFSKHNGT